jgi:lysophospholipase L1-like esterase
MLKTMLAVVTFTGLMLLPQFTPALKSFASFDPHTIPSVWDLPVPKPPPAEAGPSVDDLRARHVRVIVPPNLIDPRHELDHFYSALLKGGTVRILHYGDSPTTGDMITSDARASFQKQFGDAGAGFVLIAKPWAWYYHRGVDMESSHWTISVAGASELKDGLHGLGGASFQGGPGASATFTLKDGQHRVAEIAFLKQPEGGAFSFAADGVEIGTAETAADEKGPGWVSFELPPGSKQFTLKVTRGSVRLYGAEFRKQKPGVIYSALGVNGANITLISHAFNGAHWAAELHHYKPDLVVLAYGTNESGYPKWIDSTWGGDLTASVKRLRSALPDTSILLMSPMDRGEKNDQGEIATIAAMPRLVNIEQRVADENGVAFFNTFQAMGGAGTMARWYTSEPRLVGADYIHPMPAGAKIVGELLYGALHDGFNDYKLRQLSKDQ